MDQETIDLFNSFLGLDQNDFKAMSIQELFDLRHDMLEIMHKIRELADLQ